MGRPTIHTPDLADSLCAYVALGESIRKVCAHPGMPAVSTVFRWFREISGFQEQYAHAKEEAADMFVEDILHIADKTSKDRIPVYTVDETGKRILTGYKESKISVRRAQVQIDARKWLAVKLKPKVYGDRLNFDGNMTNEVHHKYGEMTDEELIARAKELLIASAKQKEQDGQGK